MLDKNGKEIKTGDVVRISGAYFKNDNAIFFVTHSPGDVTWSGKYHSLHKISKAGKISTAKYNLSSWPLSIMTNSYQKRVEGNTWNKEHAEIEILDMIPTAEIKAYFEEQSKENATAENDYSRRFGEQSEITKQAIQAKEFYAELAAKISA